MSNNISDSFIATYGLPKSRELSGVEPETEAAADASLSVALQKTKASSNRRKVVEQNQALSTLQWRTAIEEPELPEPQTTRSSALHLRLNLDADPPPPPNPVKPEVML